MTLPKSEYQEYQRYLRRLMDIASEQETFRIDTEDLIIKERAEERETTIKSAIQSLYQNGISILIIAQSLQISEEKALQYLSQP